ncbi:hypothetical protein CONPUDRAFT_74638 [Coniophora puteana RWD-64-598 SS2]|uniref:Uncharacterized protein n=1 Tax=Coniophora puteana (strain RWD-64-598) TaxID=741705 RepID=A0A5M3MJF6_CONPW|nr:uncharacterized protein CONPUDRAFT_74638 [Coniophora puteana RWD-64-598 SS2]EIW79127.1 hypothetical protein CONPUDRAFT_74638 [Coniophora puteana RWD-64-598 SS2]
MNKTVADMTFSCFATGNQMVKCDPREGKYVPCSVLPTSHWLPPPGLSTSTQLSCFLLVHQEWLKLGNMVYGRAGQTSNYVRSVGVKTHPNHLASIWATGEASESVTCRLDGILTTVATIVMIPLPVLTRCQCGKRQNPSRPDLRLAWCIPSTFGKRQHHCQAVICWIQSRHDLLDYLSANTEDIAMYDGKMTNTLPPCSLPDVLATSPLSPDNLDASLACNPPETEIFFASSSALQSAPPLDLECFNISNPNRELTKVKNNAIKLYSLIFATALSTRQQLEHGSAEASNQVTQALTEDHRNARGSDIRGIKDKIALWYSFEGMNLAAFTNVYHTLGFQSAVTAALLCPITYDWNNPNTAIGGQGDSNTCQSNAALHNIRTFSWVSVAYVTTLVHFVLLSINKRGKQSSGSAHELSYNPILHVINGNGIDVIWHNMFCEWWQRCIFGNNNVNNKKSGAGPVLAALHSQYN